MIKPFWKKQKRTRFFVCYQPYDQSQWLKIPTKYLISLCPNYASNRIFVSFGAKNPKFCTFFHNFQCDFLVGFLNTVIINSLMGTTSNKSQGAKHCKLPFEKRQGSSSRKFFWQRINMRTELLICQVSRTPHFSIFLLGEPGDYFGQDALQQTIPKHSCHVFE